VASPSANKRKADFPAVLPERRFVPRFVAGVGLLFLTDREEQPRNSCPGNPLRHGLYEP
jgi:hypothetical protein